MPEVSWKVWEELRNIRKRCKDVDADIPGKLIGEGELSVRGDIY